MTSGLQSNDYRYSDNKIQQQSANKQADTKNQNSIAEKTKAINDYFANQPDILELSNPSNQQSTFKMYNFHKKPLPGCDPEVINNMTDSSTRALVGHIQTMARGLILQKDNISIKLKEALMPLGLSDSTLKNISIKVESNNQIAISGIKDEELAREIERRLNEKDSKGWSLAAGIKEYQAVEKIVSSDIKKLTGKELGAFQNQDNANAADNVNSTGNNLDSPEDDTFALDAQHYSDQETKTTVESTLNSIMSELNTFEGINFSGEKVKISDPKSSSMLSDAKGTILNNIKDVTSMYLRQEFGVSLDSKFIEVDDNGTLRLGNGYVGKNKEKIQQILQELNEELTNNKTHGEGSIQNNENIIFGELKNLLRGMNLDSKGHL